MTDTRERLVQFKTNIDVAMSVLDKNGLGDWLADRLVEIGDQVKDELQLRIDVKQRPVPRRAPARREPSRRTADRQGQEPVVGRGEGSEDRAVPEGRRSGRRAPRRSPKSIKW